MKKLGGDFRINSTLLFLGAIVVYLGLIPAPRDVGLPSPSEHFAFEEQQGGGQEPENGMGNDDLDASDLTSEISDDPTANLLGAQGAGKSEAERPKPVSFCRAVLLPGVVAYALAYACLKLVNYSFFFWLPFYLKNAFGWSEADSDRVSTWYDWGGIVGGFLAGIATDKMGCRTPVIFFMLLASTAALFVYAHSPNDMLINGVLMTITGFFIGGPANLISGAVSADLGRHPDLHGNSEAIATVTGVLDGTGSVGAALGQILVPLVQVKYNWFDVFYVFIVMEFLTALCLLKLTFEEFRAFLMRIRHGTERNDGRRGEHID